MKTIIIITNELGIIYKFRYELLLKLKEKNKIILLSPIGKDQKFYFRKINELGIEIIETDFKRRKKNVFSEVKLFFYYIFLLKKYKSDMVLTYTIKPNIYGGLACSILEKKYISTVTGVGTAFQNKNILSKIVIYLNRIALKNAEKIFFQNKENMDLFIKNKIICENKGILVLGSGVNLEKFKPIKKINKKNKIQFLFIGRIMKEKGIDELLNVFDKIKLKYNNYQLNILGQFEEDYKKIFFDKKEINYLGVSTDVKEIMRDMDCIINPSWHEGMSNVLLEAGAMKKFLIASNISGCKEIVLDNITGFTYEVKNEKKLEECIIKYIELKEKDRNIMIEKQYNHIKNNFNREKIIKEYLRIIN